MSDFDLVVRGNIVECDGVIDNGWVAVSGGRVAARGVGDAPQARDSVDARGMWIIPGVLDGQVHSGFVAIPLTITSRHGLAVLACIITSTPGTIWVSYDPIGNMLLIHVLDLVDEQTWIDTIQSRYERPLLEIFE